jgi:hypothetical protein
MLPQAYTRANRPDLWRVVEPRCPENQQASAPLRALSGSFTPDMLHRGGIARGSILDVQTAINYNTSMQRGVAQVGARGVWDAEVVGSSPITPTSLPLWRLTGGSSLVGKASAFQAEDREFESRLPLLKGAHSSVVRATGS